jgi:two-component system, OmpR family, sensor kinase
LNSIRSRLLLWQMSALLIVALMAGALSYTFARRGFDEVRDYGLEQIASSVLRHDETPIPPAEGIAPSGNSDSASVTPAPDATTASEVTATDEVIDTEPDEGQFVSQVWSPKGVLVFSSLEDNGPALQPPGFHIAEWNDQKWRTYTVVRAYRTAQVAVSLRDRDSSFYALIPWVLVPIVLMMLLMGLLIHEAVKRALRPLDALSEQIGSRGLSELHALDTTELPSEVAPLALALNNLLNQLDLLLGNQRQFLADAAHELNTPLAAIKLQAQLTRKAQDSERDAALTELDTGIERAIHLASQLLQLARLEPEARTPERSEVQLHELVRQAVITLSPIAESRGIDLGLMKCESALLMADPHALRAMLDNLIDNALRYSPAGSQIDVELTVHNGQAQLRVSDNGPGIAADQRERVLERFVRLQPGETTGSGLGLAIVQHIVDTHEGTLVLQETPGGGLTILVNLPISKAKES